MKGGARELVALRSRVGELIKGTDHDRLDLLPADFSLRHLDLDLDAFKRPALRLARVIEPLRAEYDYIFLDCAPSISLVSESVFEAADALLVPIIPAALSSRTFEQLEQLAGVDADGRPGAQVLAFFSMVEVGRPMHRSVMARMRQAHHVTMLGAGIPDSEDVERMGDERDPVGAFAPASQAAMAYEALWLDLQRRLRASRG
jgi:cellulose biosynthesis protein BcsQ